VKKPKDEKDLYAYTGEKDEFYWNYVYDLH